MQIRITGGRLLFSYLLFMALCFLFGAALDAAYYGYFDPNLWQPAIVCDNPDHHFGKIAGGKPVPYEFAIRNTGNGPLTINKVNPGCGACIKIVSAPKGPIAPGEGAVIQVALQTDRLSGLVHKTVGVISNDPKRHAILLKLHAYVENPVWAKAMAAKTASKKAKKGASSRQTVSTGQTHP